MKDALVITLSYSSCSSSMLGERTDRPTVCVELGMLGCCPDPQAADVLDLRYQLSSLFKMALCTTNLCFVQFKNKNGQTWLYCLKLCSANIFTSQWAHRAMQWYHESSSVHNKTASSWFHIGSVFITLWFSILGFSWSCFLHMFCFSSSMLF